MHNKKKQTKKQKQKQGISPACIQWDETEEGIRTRGTMDQDHPLQGYLRHAWLDDG